MTTRTTLTALAMFGALACSRGTSESRLNNNMTRNDPVTLQVTNDNRRDVDIFVISGGHQRQRVGMVATGQTLTFKVPASGAYASGGLHVVVHPIGGGRDFYTEPLTISPGDEVDVTVAPVVRQTSYMIAGRDG